MGAATLVVYLFHGFVVKGAGYAGWGDWADDHAVIAFGGHHGRRRPAVAGARLAAGRRRGSTTSSTRSATPSGTCKHAVDLTAAKDQVQPEVQAEIEAGVDAGLHHRAASAVGERTGAR